MDFVTKKKDLKKPVGGLIVEEPREEDHVLGAAVLGGIAGPEFDVLVPTGHWASYTPEQEIQRNRFGDTYMCVSFSNNNVQEMLMKRLYNEDVNMSDLFLGKGSGTVRGQGNSKRTVAEWKRLNGFVHEKEYPYTPNTTLDQAYAPLSKVLLAKGKANLDLYGFYYKWVGSNAPSAMLDALRYSPLQVDVSGSYSMDKNGYVVWPRGSTYNHEVVLFDYEPNKCWWIFDSETEQYLKFAWNYPFGSPMVHSVKKKMKIQLLKKRGQSGIAVKHPSQPCLIAFSGGSVQGEDLFKAIYGVTSFAQIVITEVDEWPYPIKHLMQTFPNR